MKLLAASLIVLLAGCDSSPQQSPASEPVERHRPALDSTTPNGPADPFLTHGLLFQTDAGYEFRSCNDEATYLVNASFSILDRIDQYISTHSIDSAKPTYVRFHAVEIQIDSGLPARYASAVQIRELITQQESAPPNCN